MRHAPPPQRQISNARRDANGRLSVAEVGEHGGNLSDWHISRNLTPNLQLHGRVATVYPFSLPERGDGN